VSGYSYPRLIEADGYCPPEDVGGPWGYTQFLKAIGNTSHRRHVQYKKWFGDDFDPNAVDFPALVREMEKLAKRWSR
jgi:Plasmid pRiA4b ORF-3-like protein